VIRTRSVAVAPAAGLASAVIRAGSVSGNGVIAGSRGVTSRGVMPASRSSARLIAPAPTRAVPRGSPVSSRGVMRASRSGARLIAQARTGAVPGGRPVAGGGPVPRRGPVPGSGPVIGLVASGVTIARRRFRPGALVTVRRAAQAAWPVDRGRGEHTLTVSLAGFVADPPCIPVTGLPGRSRRTRVSLTRTGVPRSRVPRACAPPRPLPGVLRSRRAGPGIAARARPTVRRGAMLIDRPRSRVRWSGLARRCGMSPGGRRLLSRRARTYRSGGRGPGAVRCGGMIRAGRVARDVCSGSAGTVGSGSGGPRIRPPGMRLPGEGDARRLRPGRWCSRGLGTAGPRTAGLCAPRRARGVSGRRHAKWRSGRQRVARPARLVRSPASARRGVCARPGVTVRLPAPAPPRVLSHSKDRKHRGHQ